MGSLDVGSVLADTYEVTRLIGRGGMGEVWLAKHRRLPGKQVAIKVLHLNGKQLSADALTRFRREAEVATRINHPNIVEVHDFNTLSDGSPYLVLEFLQGESLASRLRHPMEVEEVQRILRQVGSALQAAHAHGVIHRDLKPDNIFIVPEPMGAVVKVLDFGISKVVDSTTLQTQEAVLVGTPAYMSPEQALGNNKDVGQQSDVFALGAIAYEMLTGAQPWVAESIAQLVFKIAYEPHRPLTAVKEGLPPNVVKAVERALLKDRALRYPDVGAFIEELTGSPLPPNRRPEEHDEPSGVATPGSGSSDSVMMGATAAATPAPVRAAATPALPPPVALVPPVAQVAARAPGSDRRRWMVGVIALVCSALFGVVFLGAQEPSREEAAPALVVAPARTGGAVAPVVADASDPVAAMPLPVAAEAFDAGVVPAAAVVKRALKKPLEEELEQLAELERLIKAQEFAAAVAITDRTNRLRLSEIGLSYAAMLITQANCGRKNQIGAQASFRQITDASHRNAAMSFCAKHIETSMLTR